jgi:twitching motility protein PilU
MLGTPRIKDLIKKSEIDTLKEAMEQGVEEGCQTFDYVLFTLYKEGKISLEQALINADSANNLRLKIKLEGVRSGDEQLSKLLEGDNKDKIRDRKATFQIVGNEPNLRRK